MKNCIYGVESYEKRQEPYTVITTDIVRDVDVCVIGSGAAGAILATKLAEAGKSVVILERGGYYDGESMNQREMDMIPLLWKDAGANFTSNLKIAIAQGSCLGGSTVINDAVCFEIPEIVREEWRSMGVSITDDQWNPAFDEVKKRIHVTEVTEDELNKNAQKLREACNKFTIDDKPIKHSKNFRNCGQSFTDLELKSCMRCGFCHLGCHYNTKQSMLVTYIHQALHNEDIDFTAYCNCKAQKITFNGNQASGVDGVFTDESGNEKYRIHVNAKVIILSAGSIASSNLLQRSMIGGYNVGRGLALHPAPFVMGHFSEEIHGNRGIPMSYTCHEFGVTNGVKKGGFLIESIFLPIFQMAMAIPTFGLSHEMMMKEFVHYTMAGLMVRDEPVGMISMTYAGTPRVDYNLSQDVVNNMARGMDILARMWFEAGADYLITSHRDIAEIKKVADIPKLKDAVRNNPDGLMLGSAHPQGGNRMGDDSSSCVVDSDCKVFDYENLFVCDASVFPTPLGVNPQLTVMALATITANKIINKWKSYDSNFIKSFGSTCDLSQPRFCSTHSLSDLYSVTDHVSSLLPRLGNSRDVKRMVGKNWNFDKDNLLIYNDLYWKGFYGRDTDALTTPIRYFGGFYKKFQSNTDNTFDGITHPFEAKGVDARFRAEEVDTKAYGKVVRLTYLDPPYSGAYDLLKMTGENTILGKAFIGSFGRGRELFSFSMSRVYDVDFMTIDDLLTIFDSDKLSHKPSSKEMVGSWEGMLVSDSAVSPRTQVFRFDYEDGEIDMRYSFADMLTGRSDITLTDKIFRMDDNTPFHDEIRMVTPDFVVGKWVTERSPQDKFWSYINDLRKILPVKTASSNEGLLEKFLDMLHHHNIKPAREENELSFLAFDNNEMGTRIGLYYILKRVSR